MIGRPALAALALLAVAAAPVDIRIEIRNATATPMECQILAAHWYTPLPAAIARPGGDVLFTFAFDVNSGQPVDDPLRRLPLETLFCGHAGRAWETRGTLDLRAMAALASVHGVARAVCKDDGDAVRCATMP
jgi:hypothetical protein